MFEGVSSKSLLAGRLPLDISFTPSTSILPATLAASLPNTEIREAFDAGTLRPCVEGFDVVKLNTLLGYFVLLYGHSNKHGSSRKKIQR